MNLARVIDIIRKDSSYSKLTSDTIENVLGLITEHLSDLQINDDVLDIFLHLDYIHEFLDEKYELQDLDIFLNLIFDNSEIKKYLKKNSIDFGDDDDDNDDDRTDHNITDATPRRLIICNIVISVLTFISVFARR